MSKIEIGRYSEQLRRMLGMKGQEVVSGELSPEISATIEIEGPGAEWNFLKGVRDASTGATIGAIAGNRPNFRLRNPTGSGVIATVQVVALVSPSGDVDIALARGLETTDLAVGTFATTVLDERWAPIGQTTLVASVTNLDALGPQGRIFVRARTLDHTEWRYPYQVVLVPGTNLDFGLLTLATGATGWVRWHERRLPRLEGA